MEIFCPDKYQNSQPNFRLATDSDKRIVTDLLGYYYNVPADQITSVKQVGEAEINSNNFLVNTSSQQLIVKRLTAHRQCSLLPKLRLYLWLHKQGIPVPRVYKNSSQKFLTSLDDHYWCVLQFIDGHFFVGTNLETIEAARVTERLFELLTNAPENCTPDDNPVEMLLNPTECQTLVNLAENRREEWATLFVNEIETVLSDGWPIVKQCLNELTVNDLLALSGFSLSHIDLHPHNLLLCNNLVAAVLDFESFRLAPRKIMVSFSAFKLLRQAFMYGKSYNIKFAPKELLKTYLSGLSRSDFLDANAGLLARMEILRRLFYILKGNFCAENANAKKWNMDIPMHMRALRETRLLFGE